MKLRNPTVALLTAALALSVPGAALADKGGVPHSGKPCPTKSEGKKPMKAKKAKKAPKTSRGKKCGHQSTPPPVEEEQPPVVEEELPV